MNTPRSKTLSGFASIHIDDVHPNPTNPRRQLRDLEDLADSIRAQGILEPLIAMPHPDKDGHYQLLAGHRRLAAAELAGLDHVPCIVRTGKTVAESLEFALVENGQRADLDPIDEAHAISQLMKAGNLTQVEVARRMGRSTVHVSNRLSLLTLTPSAQAQVKSGQMSVAAGYDKARARKGSAGSRPSMQSHFGMDHPLAANARHQCAIGHPDGSPVKKINGGQACGACWEIVIRRDERSDQ